MKKIYTLISAALLTAFGSQAESLHFTVGGEEVANGSRVNITGCYDGYMFNPHLTVTADKGGTMTGTVEVTKLSCQPELDQDTWATGGQLEVTWCAFGSCVPVKLGTPCTKSGSLTAGKPEDMELEFMITLGDSQSFEALTFDGECEFKCSFAGEDYSLTLYVTQTSGVNEIEDDLNATPEYFDLQGRRVMEPAGGIYIVRQGNKVTKRVIR